MALTDQEAADGKARPASMSTRQLAGEMVAESRLNVGGAPQSSRWTLASPVGVTPQSSRLGVMLVKLIGVFGERRSPLHTRPFTVEKN